MEHGMSMGWKLGCLSMGMIMEHNISLWYEHEHEHKHGAWM
jgi:hypothetical protein